MIGTAAFGAASLVAAYAPGPGWLIAARALLGVAGATIMPSTLSLIRSLFPDARERGTAIGIWGRRPPRAPPPRRWPPTCCSNTSGGVGSSCSICR